jgi:hypothetical protein
MSTRIVRFVDPTGSVLATARVTDEGDHFGGTIDLCGTPESIRSLFAEFEDVVNSQMFVFLDEVQAKVSAIPIRAIFDDGLESAIRDLQVFPSTGDVSFRLAGVPSRRSSPTPLPSPTEHVTG